MSKKIEDMIAEEGKSAEEAEASINPNAPLPDHVQVTRGHPWTPPNEEPPGPFPRR